MYQNFIARACFALLFFICQVTIVSAQDDLGLTKSDSLKSELSRTRDVAKRHILTYEIAYELFDVNNEEAVSYIDTAYTLALDLSDSVRIVKSGRLRGQLLRRVGRLEDAIEQLNTILPVSKRINLTDEEKLILNALAISYSYVGRYDRALDYNFRSLEIREREGSLKDISIALNNIGVTYFRMRDFEHALEFYNRSLDAKLKSNNDFDLDRLYINIGLTYSYLSSFDKAKKIIEKGFKACGDKCKDQIVLEGEFCLAGVSNWQNKFDEAKLHCAKSLDIARKIGDKRFQAENYLLMGTIHRKEKKYDEASQSLTEAEALAKKSGYNEILINTYSQFSDLYKELGDYKQTAIYQTLYIKIRDSVYSDQLIRNLATIQTAYNQRENLKTIAEQDEILKLKEEVITRQKTQYFFILTITVLSVLLTLVFIRFSRSQQQANAALTRAKREIEDKNRELEQSNLALDARVQERTVELQRSNHELQKVNDELDNFIYKTSHDIRGPLASLKGMTNVAMLDVTDATALDYFKKLDVSAEKLNSILTRLVTVNHINHVTPIPEKVDCQEIIEEILMLERKKGIPVKMSINYTCDKDLTILTDRSVLRLALENLIDNAIKFHSDSSRIEPFVKIEVKGKSSDLVDIIVTDNGIGIQESDQDKLFHMFTRASERSETGGIGLYLAKLSTEKLGGEINFTVTPEGFTRFTISVPTDLAKILSRQRMNESQRMS